MSSLYFPIILNMKGSEYVSILSVSRNISDKCWDWAELQFQLDFYKRLDCPTELHPTQDY